MYLKSPFISPQLPLHGFAHELKSNYAESPSIRLGMDPYTRLLPVYSMQLKGKDWTLTTKFWNTRKMVVFSGLSF